MVFNSRGSYQSGAAPGRPEPLTMAMQVIKNMTRQ
ncbi:phage DNA packaging protein J [Halomonas organivorans]